MRLLPLLTLFWLTALQMQSQDDFIYGPGQVECGVPNNYFNSHPDLPYTNWSIYPEGAGEILDIGSIGIWVTFYSGGLYYLIATSINSDSIFYSDTLEIYVYGSMAPEIEGCYEWSHITGCIEVCAHTHSIILFPNDNHEWSITGAESYSYIDDELVEVIWGPAGPGSLTSYQECEYSICFDILPQPVADFRTIPATITDTLTVCRDEEIVFKNLSQYGKSYLWTFGDGKESEDFETSHSYSSEGYYKVSLSSNAKCCQSEKTLIVHVLPSPSPVLDCVNSICPGSRQHYSLVASDCSEFSWVVSSNGTVVNGGGNGDDFIEIIWHNGPDGIIDLNVSDCISDYCMSSNSFRVPVITPDGPITGDVSVCEREFTTYSMPYFPGVEYKWETGPEGFIVGDNDKHSITVQWKDVSVVTTSFVSVEYNNCFLECGGNDLLQIQITPTIELRGDHFACQNSEATIESISGFGIPYPVEVQWQIQDSAGNVLFTSPGLSSSLTHTFSYPPGQYQWVALNTSPDYCNEIIRKHVEVVATPEKPLSIMGEDTICPGVPYGYSIEPAGNYATLWTVNNGTNVSHPKGQSIFTIFGNTPPYSVSATHGDIQYRECVSDTVTLTITPADQISMTGKEEVCLHENSVYSVTHIDGLEYKWEIIPADAGEIKNTGLSAIEIFWTKAGSATVRLNLCGINFDKNVIVDPLPVFSIIGPLSVCPGETVAITTNQSSYSHNWFNEVGISITTESTAQLSSGTYSVEITDTEGCSDKSSFTIESYPEPVAHLTTGDPLVSCDMIATGVEIFANTDPNINSFTWFKNGANILTAGPVFSVPDFGTYYVAVTNEFGCRAVSEEITFTNCCPPDLCGGQGGNCPNPSCRYDEFLFFDIDINAPECQLRNYRFADPSSIVADSTRWVVRSATLGVLSIVDNDLLTMDYNYPGYYQIQVIAQRAGFTYTSDLCGHYMYFNDKVPAVANFRNTGQCAGATIDFEDQSLFLPDETVMSWNWNFDDPASGTSNTSTLQNPTHVFNGGGLYNVTLTITMMSGCTSTKTIQVLITEGPDIIPVFDLIYCEDESQSFSVDDALFDVLWDFNDPSSGLQNQSSSAEALHVFELSGVYNITVSGTDEYKCRSQETFAVDIKPNLLAGDISIDPDNIICYGDTAILTSPPGGVSWHWSNGATTEITYVTESNQYSVVVQDIYHCTYSPPPEFLIVRLTPVVTIKGREISADGSYGPWQDSLFICDGTDYELQAFSGDFVAFEWLNGHTLDIIGFYDEGGNLPGPGIHTYGVTALDTWNDLCISDTAFFTVSVFPLPDKPLIQLLSGSGCSHDDNHLHVANPQAGVEYIWSDGQKGTTITTKESGIIYVTGVNNSGCMNQSNNFIIKPSANIDQIPGGCHIACDPLRVCLPSLDFVTSYNVFHNNVLLQSGGAWPDELILTEDGSYTIEITTSNGCSATSDPLDIDLYTGVGSITVLTYLDVDHDGAITAADMLLPGIPVEIISNDGLHTGVTNTTLNGEFVFEEYPVSVYTAYFSPSLLSSEWRIVIDSVKTNISTCDDSVVVSLLLDMNCTVSGTDLYFESCPGESVIFGDSTWTNTGQYEVHLVSTLGCDSVFTVNIVWPDSIDVGTTVWVDVDHNGVLSASDTVIGGITIVVDAMINQAPYIDVTDVNGFVKGGYPSQLYMISVDSTLLPSGFSVVHGLDFISDTICGPQNFDFLIVHDCSDVFIIQHESICIGDSVLVEGQWIDSAGLHSFLLSEPGLACDSILDVYVAYYPVLTSTALSAWDCVDLGSISVAPAGTGPYQYEWAHAASGGATLTGLDEGEYYVTITDVNGCHSTNSILIDAPPPSLFYIEPEYEITAGDSVMLTITGDIPFAGSYAWTQEDVLACDTCVATFAFPQSSIAINIEITDIHKCIHSLLTNIIVSPAIVDTAITDNLYIPNVFSPNGDGINDEFSVYARHPDAYLNRLEIFDRWGNLLYIAGDLPLENLRGWDGTFRNQQMNPQVFAYKADVTLADGRKLVIYGDVSLVR